MKLSTTKHVTKQGVIKRNPQQSKIYVAAVQGTPGIPKGRPYFFSFPTAKNRSKFLRDMEKEYPRADIFTTEIDSDVIKGDHQ